MSRSPNAGLWWSIILIKKLLQEPKFESGVKEIVFSLLNVVGVSRAFFISLFGIILNGNIPEGIKTIYGQIINSESSSLVLNMIS